LLRNCYSKQVKILWSGHVVRKIRVCLEKGDNTRHVTRKKEQRKTQNILETGTRQVNYSGF